MDNALSSLAVEDERRYGLRDLAFLSFYAGLYRSLCVLRKRVSLQ